jgi:hypothetical protein
MGSLMILETNAVLAVKIEKLIRQLKSRVLEICLLKEYSGMYLWHRI